MRTGALWRLNSAFLIANRLIQSMKLTLCPKSSFYSAGIRHPCETKFDNHVQDLEHSNYTLNIPLIPTTPEEMEDMFKLCSHVRFKIPQQVRPSFQVYIFFVLFYALIICNHDVDYKNNKYRVVIVLLNCFVIRSLAYFVTFLLKLLFRWLDPSRPGRCPRASQHILPRRSVHFVLKYFSIFQFSGKIPVNSLFL